MSDEALLRLGPGVFRVSTIQDPMADSAYNIYTQSTTSDATLYLTFVNSNNTPAAKEILYTNYGLTYNPLIGNLSIGSSVQISPNSLIYNATSFYIGNSSITGITSFSGKIRLGGNSILSSSGDTVVSFAGTNTEFSGNVTVLGNFNTNNVNAGIITATRFVGDGSQLTGIVAGSSYASSAGIATVAQNLTGTPNLVVGIVTATSFIGDGSQLTGISAGSGIATYAQVAGIATYSNTAGISTFSNYSNSSGIASASQSLIGTPNLIVGIVTATRFLGDGSQLTGINVGIPSYANTSGVSTYSNTAGISTVAGYANIAGVSTTSQSLTGAPNLIVGIVTANSFIGDGSQLTGISTNSPYASVAGISTVSGYATNSGVSTYSNNSGIATVATYANTSGISTTSQGLTGTPNLVVGIVTATSFIGNGSQLTGISTIVPYSNVSGISTVSGYATSSGVSTISGYANTSGISTTSQGLTGTPNLVVGIVTATSFIGNGSQLTGISSIASYATSAGIATFSQTDYIKLFVSNRGETVTPSIDFVETTVPRACQVIGATWECSPAATGSSTSQAMLYARRSGTKTNLLSANASLAGVSTVPGYFIDVTNTLTGITTLATADSVGVNLVSIGTSSSGHIFTITIRYSS